MQAVLVLPVEIHGFAVVHGMPQDLARIYLHTLTTLRRRISKARNGHRPASYFAF